MGYVILFSNSSETHTYVISLIGYLMWYWTMRRAGALVMADDVLCPPAVMKVFYSVKLNLWLLLAMWSRMVWSTFVRIPGK